MAKRKKYPCEDSALRSLPGEIWKELPGLDNHYLVSSHGRIKSLPRMREFVNHKTGKVSTYLTKERIRKIKIHKKWNAVIGKPYFECMVALYPEPGRVTTSGVHRLVYQAFIGDIDFDIDRIMIMHKDGNGLNNHFSNLVAGSREQVLKRAYKKKRHISPFALKTEEEFKEISRRAAITKQKKVVKYSLAGNRLKVYASLLEAQKENGISNLVPALKGRLLTAGGFIWRYFPGPAKIDGKAIRERKLNKSVKFRKAVGQYSPEGKLLKTYVSLAEAAARTSVSSSGISNCLAGRIQTCGGYQWKEV